MEHHKADEKYILIINKGEDTVASITQFCKDEAIHNAHFSAIGAVEYAKCGYYDLQKKEYFFTEYTQMLEVASATGNVMLKDSEPFVHLHAVFTDKTNAAFGGHVQEMRVGITLEVMLTPFYSEDVERTYNEEIGLYLINCP